MEILLRLFSGIGTFFTEDPLIALVRFLLIVCGFALAYLGFKRKLDPLIMVPMGLGMIAINAGVLFLNNGTIGTIMLDPMVSETNELMSLMQVNFLQPIYALTFSNGLIGCLIYLGIGTMSDVSFLLARPWASIIVALFAELGTFVMLVIGYQFFGLPLNEAAAIATIGGADGPLVMFSALIMSPNLFVPIAIIAYLYLTLAYAGFPYLVRLMVPKNSAVLKRKWNTRRYLKKRNLFSSFPCVRCSVCYCQPPRHYCCHSSSGWPLKRRTFSLIISCWKVRLLTVPPSS